MSLFTRNITRRVRAIGVLFFGALGFASASPPAQAAGTDVVTIHYHRYDGDYEGLGIWTWDERENRTPEQNEIFPVGEDGFGKILRFSPGEYGTNGDPAGVGIIPRLRGSWNHKDGGDRFWRPAMGNEIWLIGNDPNIYTSPPDVSPRIHSALIDGHHTITIRFTHPVDGAIPSNIEVATPSGERIDIDRIEPVVTGGRTYELQITTRRELTLKDEFRVTVEGYAETDVVLGDLVFDPERFHTDARMGLIYSPEKSVFRVFAPTAREAEVVLYDSHVGSAGRQTVAMRPFEAGVWEAVVEGDLRGKHYMLKVNADGHSANREVVDIYSIANTGRAGRGKIVDPRLFDPEGFRAAPRPDFSMHPQDAVIWEVSIRDFTRDESSGVPAELRGKYLGGTKRDTRVPGTGFKTGIDHLVDLGVTHVQILPIQDFDNREEDDQYNWGYMTSSFNSPDGWFATNIHDTSRISEFKRFVQAMHDAGIRVIMDVVYNHTAPNATFESLAPNYYHRMKPDGSFWNGSGTGNELRSEAPMARKFIIDSCLYWIDEYKVDGFRFDLMGLVDAETMKQLREELQAVDPTLLLYGEPWAGGESGLEQLTDKGMAASINVGAFNDHFRNAIKGPPDGNEPGFVQTGQDRDAVKRGIAGAIDDWAREPHQPIQYVTCHDNLTLWDKVEVSAPDASFEDRVRMNELAIGILAVSQGPMFLHAGAEIGYSKDGEHNSYNKPDSINSIKWGNHEQFARLYGFTKGMIALRRAHPVFRLRSADEIRERIFFHDDNTPNAESILFTLDGSGVDGESWAHVAVLINAAASEGAFKLPDGAWTVEAGSTELKEYRGRSVNGEFTLPGRTMAVLKQ